MNKKQKIKYFWRQNKEAIIGGFWTILFVGSLLAIPIGAVIGCLVKNL